MPRWICSNIRKKKRSSLSMNSHQIILSHSKKNSPNCEVSYLRLTAWILSEFWNSFSPNLERFSLDSGRCPFRIGGFRSDKCCPIARQFPSESWNQFFESFWQITEYYFSNSGRHFSASKEKLYSSFWSNFLCIPVGILCFLLIKFPPHSDRNA